MTIQLPNDLESSVQAAVHSGRFASLDDAMAEAVRLLLREPKPGQPQGNASTPDLGSIGAMRDAADELDEIVADAYRKRREESWRDISVGVERLRPRENDQRSGGGEWGGNGLDFPQESPGSVHNKIEGPLGQIGPIRAFAIRRSVDGSSQRGRACATT